MSKVYLKHTLKEGDHSVMHKGKPPHVGWWVTAVRPDINTGEIEQHWRWWDGKLWSTPITPAEARSPSTAEVAGRRSEVPSMWGNNDIYWCYAWPKNARVGRVNPDTGEVTGAGPDPYKVQAAAPKPVRRSRWTKAA